MEWMEATETKLTAQEILFGHLVDDPKSDKYQYWTPLPDDKRVLVNDLLRQTATIHGQGDFCAHIDNILWLIRKFRFTVEIVSNNQDHYVKVGSAKIDYYDFFLEHRYTEMLATHLCIAYLVQQGVLELAQSNTQQK